MDEQLHNKARVEHLRPVRHRWNLLQTHHWALPCLFVLVLNPLQSKNIVPRANCVLVGTTHTRLGRQISVSPKWTTHGLLHRTSPRDKSSGMFQILACRIRMLTIASAACQRMPGNRLLTAAAKITASHRTKARNNSRTPRQAKNSSSTPPLVATTATTASANSSSLVRIQ